MAKKISICVLFVLLVGGAWWQNAYITGTAEKLGALLNSVEQALESEDMRQAVSAADIFYESWGNEKQCFEALLDHNGIDMISATSARLRSFCSTGYREGALAETKALQFYIRHLSDLDSIGWENIF